ncbi:MAG: helix-turn-helix domain-containing protein [Planctomycetaceae bacterium]|nr:helix-turn-helix domain-containing protein [Planctomycetaceae bacterium]
MPDTEPSLAKPLLLKAAGAAAECGVSVRTWYAWDISGRVPCPIRIGRTPFWPYEELRAWVAAGCPDRVTWQASRNCD